ncbi:AraC family transcriptional regulator [Pseudonocardia bannensis]|uniref:AraC family transcriptional regulator n=1 Tax=Pseudonocardia bannensis TaxID=630973 RepID=A0A848DLE7_9PSEU|nr:AraC family transcriptional regulator [Pseudonocardia bannensis]NMH93590.1 AraC family transcriptional regulator [Pseudonocardia bannensis]
MPSVATGAEQRSPVTTADLEQARESLSEVYYPLRLQQLDRTKEFTFEMATVDLGPLTLGRLTYGSDISLDCGDLGTAYHVNLPLSGHVVSRCGVNEIVATPETAAVFGPVGHTVLDRWAAGSTQLCLKIDRGVLEAELVERLDVAAVDAVQFEFPMNMAGPAGQSWLSALQILANELSQPGGLAAHPILAAEVQRLIITGLLLCQQHNYSDALNTPGLTPRERAVRGVVDLIDERPDHPWTVPDLARAAGISVRSLEDGFRRYLDTSPRAYLRERRLCCAHEELVRSSPSGVSVTEVAYRWGFAHLGRFALAYRKRFGVTPSETLKATRLSV